jgi:hypothetical protein
MAISVQRPGAAVEPFHQAVPAFIDDADLNIGEARRVSQKGCAQRSGRQRHVEADAQPAGFAAAGGADVGKQRFQIAHDAPGVFQKDLAGIGRTDAVAMSLKQGDANAGFKLADTPADGRSLNAQLRSGSVKTPLLRRGQDLKQCIELNVPDHAKAGCQSKRQSDRTEVATRRVQAPATGAEPWPAMFGQMRVCGASGIQRFALIWATSVGDDSRFQNVVAQVSSRA